MRGGIGLVLLSALAFGVSGPFAKALIDAGWTPGAAVTVRIVGAAVVLAVVVAVRWRAELVHALRSPGVLLGYGVFAVAGVQVCFFMAIETLSVGVALLLEYLGLVLVVGWVWLRSGRRPATRTLVGTVLALVGTVGVLDVLGGARVDLGGVLWALAAAVCLATYFVMLGGQADARVHPPVLSSLGMVVGAVVVLGAGWLGVLDVDFGGGEVLLAGGSTGAWVPLAMLVGVSTVLAYLAGAAGIPRVGATTGSLLGLSEVLFAVLASWALLGELPTTVQLAGAVLVVAGVVLARSPAENTLALPAPVEQPRVV